MSEERIDIDKINTLDDYPSNEDEFKGSSHENVAKALVKIISKNEGGYAIGLEGSWGSGKSTIINIAEKIIDQDEKDDYLFFNFDAWAHQGDPIRRSFLECLFGFLNKKNIVSIRSWVTRLRKIRAQQKKVISESIPKVPFFNYLIVIYGLCLPFLIIYANDIYKSGDLSTLVWPAILIILPPILIAVVTYVFRQCTNSQYKNLPVLPSTRYLSQKSKTEQYIHTEDATTIEFNKYFDDLVEKVKDSRKKLIVVIDNLDRLSPDEIKSMWGTMRNFFTSQYWTERHDLLKTVYLVVPYDRGYIAKIFSENNQKDEFGNFATNTSRSESGFIEKTFNINLKVSEPILTHWKAFFFSKLDSSFGNQLSSDQKFDLYKLFEFKSHEDNFSITPRRIKKFVNNLVVQVIEWNNLIPIKYLGLYILNSNNLEINPRKLVIQNLLDERTRDYLEGEDWFKYFAAAYHKVHPDQALQIALSIPIKTALVNGDIKEINKLKENEWFEDILNLEIEENSREWAQSEPKTYSKVAKSIGEINIKSAQLERKIWDNLAKKALYLPKIKSPDKNQAVGFASIIENSSKNVAENYIVYFFKKLSTDIPQESEIREFTSNYIDYLSVLAEVTNSIFDETFLKKQFNQVRLPKDEFFTIQFAGQSLITDEVVFKDFNYECSDDEITEKFKKLINEEAIYDLLLEATKSFLESKSNLNWSEIGSLIKTRVVNNSPNLTSTDLGTLLNILMVLNKEDLANADAILSNLNSSGVLLALIDRSKQNNFTTGLILLEIIRLNNQLQNIRRSNNVPTYGDNNPGLTRMREILTNPDDFSSIITEMASTACELGYFNSIVESINSSPNDYVFLEKLALAMIELKCINGVNITANISNFDRVQFVSENNKVSDFFHLIDNIEFNVDEISELSEISVSFLDKSLSNSSIIGSQLAEKIQAELNNLDIEEWQELLANNDHIINLLLTLIENDCGEFLSEDFNQSLLNHLQIFLNSELALSDIGENWPLLPKAMLENTRVIFYERLFNKLVSDYFESERIIKTLNFIAKDALKTAVENEADLFIKNVINVLLNSDDVKSLNWIEENIEVVNNAYKSSTKNSKGHLNEIVQSKNQESEEVRDKILPIAKELGIDLEWD